jgi:hypothetical protein
MAGLALRVLRSLDSGPLDQPHSQRPISSRTATIGVPPF